MEQQSESQFQRMILSIVLLAIMLMACVTHASRYLNLSGDELFFYFLGMKDNWSDYRPHYEQIRDEFVRERQEPYFQSLSSVQLDNFGSAEYYLGLEARSFSEYRLPRLVWGAVSGIIAPTNEIVRNDEAFSEGLADSVFFMLMAGYLMVCLVVIAITYRLSAYAKAALITFVLITFFKESFVNIDTSSYYRIFPDVVGAFLSTAVSPSKDFMTFAFSGRSLLLLVLPAYLACRWDLPSKNSEASLGSYPILPILTLVHAAHGTLVTGMFLVIDGLMWRQRLTKPLVLASYAASFGLASDGGIAANPWIFAFLLLMTLCLALAGAIGARGAAREALGSRESHTGTGHAIWTTWRGEALLLTIFAFAYLALAQTVLRRFHLQGWDYWWVVVSGIRFGSIFTVMLLFTLSWLGVGLASRKLTGRLISSVRKTALATLAAPLILMIVVATDLSFDLASVRARLRAQSASYLQQMNRPLSFRETNELHVIWLSIIKSASHNKSYPVKLQLVD